MSNPNVNPVGYLQEFVQKYNVASFPKYDDLGYSGPDHSRIFKYKCVYDGFEVIATASTKKQAKSEVASKMVKLLNDEGYFTKHTKNVTDISIPDIKENGLEDSSLLDIPSKSSQNAISVLQEHCQKTHCQLPNYVETSDLGDGFLFRCELGTESTFGQATTKKSAKLEAAFNMCVHLKLFEGSVKKDPKSLERTELSTKTSPDMNYVSQLQEYCAGKKIVLPIYDDGKDMTSFIYNCSVGNISGSGRGLNKKDAKQMAAKSVLDKILKTDPESSRVVQVVKREIVNGYNYNKDALETDETDTLNEYYFADDGNEEDIVNNLESLSLNDTVVKREPSSESVGFKNKTLVVHNKRD